MAPSSSSDTRAVLAGYLAGTVKPERLVAAVAAAYYRDEGRGTREGLRAVIEVMERAAPGIVELAKTEGAAGFEVRLAERRFPKEYEPQLRSAVEAVMAGAAPAAAPVPTAPPAPQKPGLFARLVTAVRRLFSASA